MKRIILCLVILLILCSCKSEPTYESQNKDAILYKNKGCVIFYPNNIKIANYVRNYCRDNKEEVVDYTVEPYFDFIKVIYPGGKTFVLNKDYSNISLKIVDKKMLSELFIYEYKKSENNTAYTTDFLIKNHYSNINVDDFKVTYDNDKITIKSLNYYFNFNLDLGYSKQLLDADFGEYKEYKKQTYISRKRPMVALTYDDGPYKPIDKELFDLYDLYDSRCTFFIVGNRLTDSEIESVKEGISLGYEYGSHSYAHNNIKGMKSDNAFETMMQPVKELKDKLDYDVKTYRQPYGYRKSTMEKDLKDNNMIGVLWNIDSQDWKSRDKDSIINEINKSINENDVVLMHSIYEPTLEASKEIVPNLINKGYQLVTVSELIDYLDFDGEVFFGE